MEELRTVKLIPITDRNIETNDIIKHVVTEDLKKQLYAFAEFSSNSSDWQPQQLLILSNEPFVYPTAGGAYYGGENDQCVRYAMGNHREKEAKNILVAYPPLKSITDSLAEEEQQIPSLTINQVKDYVCYGCISEVKVNFIKNSNTDLVPFTVYDNKRGVNCVVLNLTPKQLCDDESDLIQAHIDVANPNDTTVFKIIDSENVAQECIKGMMKSNPHGGLKEFVRQGVLYGINSRKEATLKHLDKVINATNEPSVKKAFVRLKNELSN